MSCKQVCAIIASTPEGAAYMSRLWAWLGTFVARTARMGRISVLGMQATQQADGRDSWSILGASPAVDCWAVLAFLQVCHGGIWCVK